MGKFKRATVGYSYYMDLHMGVGRGPVDELMEIEVGGRTAWKGSITENKEFIIDKPKLFGGSKAEGGIDGVCQAYFGEPDQVLEESIYRRFLPRPQPGFRGVFTLHYWGMVSQMTPYIKSWRFKVRRILKGWDGPVWYAEKAKIEMEGYDDEGNPHIIHAMNPAHILYECLTNRDWGRGLPRDMILESEWRKVADALYDEGFGMCIVWRRQDTLESFIQMILNHIMGVLYVDKFTGKFKLKVLRKDFDEDSLPVYSFDSGLLKIDEATNGAISGLMNECVVKWFNPLNGQENLVRAQNLALIQTSGGIKSDTYTYQGVPTAKLATVIAERDLRITSTNVRRFTLTCDRRAWRIQPGDVFKIRDPETRGLESVIVRVADTEESKQTDGQIRIICVQDTFTFDLNTFTGVQEPSFPAPDLNPKLARRRIYEMTYAEIVSLLPPGEIAEIKESYGFLRTQAEKGSPVTMAYDIAVLNDATGAYVQEGNGDFTTLFELSKPLEYLDSAAFIKGVSGTSPIEVGDFIYMNGEIMVVTLAPSNGLIGIRRGVYDTVPQQHAAESIGWVITQGGGSDYKIRQAGEEISVKVLPWTLSGGTYPEEDAPFDLLEFNYRYIRPYAPGRVEFTTVENTEPRPWFTGHVLRADVGSQEVPDAMTITWTHRDRLMQQDKAIYHEMDSVGPEDGTTYRITILNARGQVIRRETGISGTSFTYTYGQAALDFQVEASPIDPVSGYLKLESMRDGFESWQGYLIPVTVHKKPPQLTYVSSFSQPVAQIASEIDTESPESDFNPEMYISHQAQINAQEATEIDPNGEGHTGGANINFMAQPVSQNGTLIPVVDSLMFEFPYLLQLRHGFDGDASRFFMAVARPSDRVTDGFDLFEREKAEDTLVNNGAQPWTPWGVTTAPLNYLDNEITLGETSDADGVPIGDAMPGDIIAVNNELMVVEAVDGKTLKVGRGSVDTVPTYHYARSVVWFVNRQIAVGNRRLDLGQTDVMTVRPHSLAAEINPKDIQSRMLPVKLRSDRPYPPGFVLGNGRHFFEAWDARADEFDYYAPRGKDLVITWAHRNREDQGGKAFDHLATGFSRPGDVVYRLWVGFTYTPRFSNKSRTVTLGEFFTRDAGYTITAAQAEEMGLRAGRIKEQSAYTYVNVTLNAVADELTNWVGYQMQVALPSYPADRDKPKPDWKPQPDRPGGGHTGGGGTGGGNPGDPSPEPVPKPTEPDNPDPVPNPGDPDPEPPKPKPPVDVAGWSIAWDHDWAEDLPEQTGENI